MDDWQPITSAVLVADTLIVDYLRTARVVSQGGPDQTIDTFRAQMAAASRTYPAIWEHLDRARELIVAAGKSAPAFDELRAQIGASTHDAVKRYDSSEGNLGLPMGLASSVLALPLAVRVETNVDGALLAWRASGMLKQAVPEVDWAAAARQADEPVADLRASGPSDKVFYGVAFGVLAVLLLLASIAYFR